jgi:hypothetical protein
VTDEEIRQLVRESIARHTRRVAPAAPAAPSPDASRAGFALFHLSRADGVGECLIEPAVRCTHCGFCQTYGH